MPPSETGTEPAVAALARTALAKGVAALAAQDPVTALRWLERAHRLVPHDPNATLTLASTCLADDPLRAETLFTEIAAKFDVRQAWLGLAAARLRLYGADAARAPLEAVLSRHAFVAETGRIAGIIAGSGVGDFIAGSGVGEFIAGSGVGGFIAGSGVGDVIAGSGVDGFIAGSAGWCALRPDGALEIHPGRQGRIQVTLDGKTLRDQHLPAAWPRARTLEIQLDGKHLLGSPIQLATIRRLTGCVETTGSGISIWAWYPNDPETAPVLTLTFANGEECTLTLEDESLIVPDNGPLARPRNAQLTRDELPGAGLVHVRGPDGNDLTGSPLDPFADEAAHVAAAAHLRSAYPAGTPAPDQASATSPTLRADAPAPKHPVGADTTKRPATIVIPVHDGGPVVLACLDSVLASLPAGAKLLVVDDGSSDPALTGALDRLRKQRKISLLRHGRARGFPAAANAGIQAVKGRDVVLLNSDTIVPPGWLDRLRDAAYAAPDIGTVTPLSNDASILSYPGPAGTNPRPDQAETNRLDRLAARANATTLVDIPVGVGFCLYLRRDCLTATGAFRDDVFAQGYGEENDLCLRARRLGWRNVAHTGLFVGHAGGATFGASASHLRRRNARLIEQLHPGYQTLIDSFLAADPLALPRRRIDLIAWAERGRAWRQAAILITHNDGGGVEQRMMTAARAHAAAGRRPIIIRPAELPGGEAAIAIHDGLSNDFPNLVFALQRERPAVLRLLRAAKADRIEAHHLADYPAPIYDLIRQLDLPYDVHVHDYAWFCPRILLVAAHNRYCGEPDLRDCEACIADNGHFLKEDISVAALRDRSAGFLTKAKRVVVPADDTGIRMRRYFEGLPTLTVPHEDDDAIIPNAVAPGLHINGHAASIRTRPGVCVVGSIGVYKGYDILLACARDADRRDLDLEFVVVGHTIDDTRLMDTGRVFVTGRFDRDEAVGLIAAQNARLGFVPSICPETWCLGLTDLWRAGLNAVAFDIGAPAERIRRTGRGIVLPLGLSANAINNTLVAAIQAAGH